MVYVSLNEGDLALVNVKIYTIVFSNYTIALFLFILYLFLILSGFVSYLFSNS
jgi:hypothetical protein